MAFGPDKQQTHQEIRAALEATLLAPVPAVPYHEHPDTWLERNGFPVELRECCLMGCDRMPLPWSRYGLCHEHAK